ncbi:MULTISPECIES: SCO2525 family SAM-dependent methyltransferase [Streptomyces]|uniref:Methyltransferase n=1 Tax=Streptomyces lycii TaxID=2654337 RepID=A0ABQ7FMP8_9ACTN|nr:SCO2525 family SAM-dependent methyltransferase [Streptomyces lycii]KAF4409975.1 methyltransferase [Streptomyces lycii]
MVLRPPAPGVVKAQELNDDADWNAFDSEAYVAHNYRDLRPDDEQIIRIVRDYFTDHFRRHPGDPVPGIDVGSGANLYPALTLLPWCSEITLFEYAATNAAWLERQVTGYEPNWDAFWDVLREARPYAGTENPRAALRLAARVKQGNLFSLPEARWGIGTMFFVAESMTTAHEEFQEGVRRFAECLLPGAPFAAAFMEGSEGYAVGDEFFPACSVTGAQVRDTLTPFAEGEVQIHSIGIPGDPLRVGYKGMLVACGRRNSD